MANVIADLTGADASAAPAPAAPEIPALADTSRAPTVQDQARLVLRGIASGQIPGAFVPKGVQPMGAGLSPEELKASGIGIYRPQDKSLLAVAFSPDHLSEKMLVGMDKAGTLKDNLPNMVDLLKGGSGAAAGAPAASEASPGELGPAPSQTPPTTSSIMPKPTFGADAQAQAANARIDSLSQEPSKRRVPGGGQVLNGLIARAV